MQPNNFSRLFRGEVQRQWALLDSESVDPNNNDRDNLVDLLSARYGFSGDRAWKEIDRVYAELSEKLELAA